MNYGIVAYQQSITLAEDDPSFYALIMAAMRKADDTNLEKLKTAFPDVYIELVQRYNAPGGCLDDDETAWFLRTLGSNESEDGQ